MQILPLGDAALTVQLGNSINQETHQLVINYCQTLAEAKEKGKLEGVVEWLAAFCSVTIYFNPLLTNFDQLSYYLGNLNQTCQIAQSVGRQWKIPILFDSEVAPDLNDVAEHCNISIPELITKLCKIQFRVYMLGFMPGFPYMGGLPHELEVSRLATPRKIVPAKSLAIAGNMCAIYPWQSPGGWRLIGRTPLSVFDSNNLLNPALFAPGDLVNWLAINKERFVELNSADENRKLDLQQFCNSN